MSRRDGQPDANATCMPKATSLVLGEMLTETVIYGVVDGQMVGGEEIGEPQRRPLGIGQIGRLGRLF